MRSFIQPLYQPSEQFRKGLFSLDNLWDGLGAIVVDNPDQRHFFGKVICFRYFKSFGWCNHIVEFWSSVNMFIVCISLALL